MIKQEAFAEIVNTLFSQRDPEDRGDWTQLFSGGKFYPLDPRPDEIHIADIAWGLSNVCRYGGQTRCFYSVAEHSLLISNLVLPEHSFAALMHDCAEAFVGDVIRPLKKYLIGYQSIEDRIMQVIAEKFNFSWPLHESIKEIDNAIIANERKHLFLYPSSDWKVGEPLPNVEIQCLTPQKAYYSFIERYVELRYATEEI